MAMRITAERAFRCSLIEERKTFISTDTVDLHFYLLRDAFAAIGELLCIPPDWQTGCLLRRTIPVLSFDKLPSALYARSGLFA